MAQLKDFIQDYCSKTQLSKELVGRVTEDFVVWIKDIMLHGDDVRLPEFGKFKIQLNTYSHSGLMKNGASLHYHEFRPAFRFITEFRRAVDAHADSIRAGYEKREDTREAKRRRKEEKKKGL